MSTERRFLIAPSLARLLLRERGTTSRIVEAYFPPRPDRRQFVRVEQNQSRLVLLTQTEDGRFAAEETEIPQLHAEALIDAAAGTVAYDRMSMTLGAGVEATLDHFIAPRGLDLLTVTILSDPSGFAPPRWFGLEVTDEPSFAALSVALDGVPKVDAMEPSNAALEELLDTLDGRGLDRVEAAAAITPMDAVEATAPSIPVALGLEASPPMTGSPQSPSRSFKGLAFSSNDDQEEIQESLSIRSLARPLSPRWDRSR